MADGYWDLLNIDDDVEYPSCIPLPNNSNTQSFDSSPPLDSTYNFIPKILSDRKLNDTTYEDVYLFSHPDKHELKSPKSENHSYSFVENTIIEPVNNIDENESLCENAQSTILHVMLFSPINGSYKTLFENIKIDRIIYPDKAINRNTRTHPVSSLSKEEFLLLSKALSKHPGIIELIKSKFFNNNKHLKSHIPIKSPFIKTTENDYLQDINIPFYSFKICLGHNNIIQDTEIRLVDIVTYNDSNKIFSKKLRSFKNFDFSLKDQKLNSAQSCSSSRTILNTVLPLSNHRSKSHDNFKSSNLSRYINYSSPSPTPSCLTSSIKGTRNHTSSPLNSSSNIKNRTLYLQKNINDPHYDPNYRNFSRLNSSSKSNPLHPKSDLKFTKSDRSFSPGIINPISSQSPRNGSSNLSNGYPKLIKKSNLNLKVNTDVLKSRLTEVSPSDCAFNTLPRNYKSSRTSKPTSESLFSKDVPMSNFLGNRAIFSSKSHSNLRSFSSNIIQNSFTHNINMKNLL
ncbi:hypothetical protein AYI70_g3882 [Smittium culicis]|uniref:Uncharacterized protein n=1 Tax=Smittium culicis TaxID=133412 RepID=A0A1R1Y1U2_9FUNG|nr:hypothetical protein AYI70_g3882 [Smittium culicis]